MRTLVALLVFGLSQFACDIAPNSKKKKESPKRDLAAEENASFSLKLEGVVHLFVVKKDDNEKRVAGFDSLGLPMYRNIVSPSSLKILDFVHLVTQKLLLFKFAPLENRPAVKAGEKDPFELSSGEDIFRDCDGLILYSIVDSTSECFDRSSYPIGTRAEFTLLQDGAVDNTAVFAVRKLIDDAGGVSSVQLVKRISKSSFGVLTETIAKPGMEFVSQSKLGLLTREKSAEGVEEWVATAGSGANYTPVKLDFHTLLGEADGCFYYVKSDKRTFALFCPFANTVIDTLTATLPDDFDLESLLLPMGTTNNQARFILNEKGQGLVVKSNSECCSLRVIEDAKTVYQAKLFGSRLFYVSAGTGVHLLDLDSNAKAYFLDGFLVLSMELNQTQDRLLFIAIDAKGTQVSGSIALTGDDLQFKDY